MPEEKSQQSEALTKEDLRCYKELAFLLSAPFRVRIPVGIIINTKTPSTREDVLYW